MTAPARSVFAEALAQAREALAIAWPEGDHAEPNVFTDALAALDLIEQQTKEMEQALGRIAERQPTTLDWLRANGIVFDGPLGTDPDNWEHVAFSIYSDLCETDAIARAALSAREEARSTVVSYEFDGEGRAYSRHANGEVLPTGYVARSFAGKSGVTPQRFQEIRGEEAQ